MVLDRFLTRSMVGWPIVRGEVTDQNIKLTIEVSDVQWPVVQS